MVTKGIITSIDFNGNTCQVRIPLFETAGNDPITGTAIVSNTPGSYNGYKVGDVVLVAFEDGKMQNPVIIGKLYLGAAKEKQDPRGTINVETTTASKSASLPADAVLTANVDSNVPNTNTPFGSLASIANNLNSLNTDVNQLDRFTRNQFNSVITDVNKQGEELRSEIKQTAKNIEAKVDKEHDSTTTSLGWNLTDTKWTIDATNTDWSPNKLTLFEVDRNGQVIINGNVRIGGYPQSRTRFYKKLAADSESPEAPKENITTEELPDEGWYETYEWENTYHIWETIQTIIYDTNDKGELQLKITYSTPVDITGAAGEQGISIKSQIIYYAMVDSDITHVEKPDYAPKGGSNQDNRVYGNSADDNIIDLTAASPVKGYGWSTTPHEYIDGWNYYTSVLTIYSDDDQTALPAINHRNFADPVKAQELDGVYELAQGKSKNYYSETDPAGTSGDAYGLTMRKGYCWFDTGYTQISTPEAKSDYLGKWLRIQDANGGYVVKSGENPVRLIQWKDGITDQRYNMIKVGPENIDTLISNKTIVVGTTEAFETGILSQWNGTNWVDISGELVTNKLTTNYINALDITTKKIHVKDANGNTLFKANGIAGETDSNKVKIGGFDVDHNKLSIGTIGTDNSVALISDNNIKSVSIAKSSEKNDWRIVAGENFGVDSSGKTYMSDINIDGIEFNTSHSEPGKYFRIKVSAENVDNGVKFTAATLDGLLENNTDVNIKYFNSKGQQLSTTITILAGESEGSTIVKDAILDKFSWDPEYVDSTLGDFFNAYGYFNDKNKMHCAGYSFDLMPGGHGGNWDRAKSKTVSWYRITWERINSTTMTKKLVALNDSKWVTNDDVVCHAIDKHEFTKIHSIIEQWNSTKQHGIVAKTYKPTKIIARGKASSDGLSVYNLKYYGGYTGDASISISLFNQEITNDTITGKCSMTINGETIKLEGPCWKSGTSAFYESNLTGTSSKTGKSYNLIVSRLSAGFPDIGFPDIGGIPGSSSSGNLKAMLTETDNNTNLPDIKTAKLITINPRFSLVNVDDSNEDVIYLYSKISNVPQIDIKNDTKQSASYIFMPLSSDPASTSIDLSESDFVKFSLEPEESAGARYFIFEDDKLNVFVYGKNYSSTWGQAQDKFEIKIEPSKKDENDILETVTIEEICGLKHAPQEILDIDIDDHKVDGLNWLSVHSYVENNEIKIILANVSNANSEAVSIDVIVNYAWQQEI